MNAAKPGRVAAWTEDIPVIAVHIGDREPFRMLPGDARAALDLVTEAVARDISGREPGIAHYSDSNSAAYTFWGANGLLNLVAGGVTIQFFDDGQALQFRAAVLEELDEGGAR